MHISFSGVIAIYTYNCPYAHKLRNIDRVRIDYDKPEEPREELGQSRRERGIELHEQAAKYVKQELQDFEFNTATLQLARSLANKETEQQYFLDTWLNPLPEKPSSGDFVSFRTDVTARSDSVTRIFDWKFGNPEFGIAKHLDELKFFVACESAKYPEVGQWEIIIHFPELDYTVPTIPITYTKAATLQQIYVDRIQHILRDKFYRPYPGRSRCRLCPYRTAETGGSDHCPYTVI
jgi:hypothetical protein